MKDQEQFLKSYFLKKCQLILDTLSMYTLQASSDLISSITKAQTYFFPFAIGKANELGEINIISSGSKQ